MDQRVLGQWGSIAVSVLSLLIFVGVVVVALAVKNEQMLLMLVGAAIANAGTAVQFWLGSSASSQKKDETIASHKDGP